VHRANDLHSARDAPEHREPLPVRVPLAAEIHLRLAADDDRTRPQWLQSFFPKGRG
jgi:hypothetical protein